jgi:hypothetical protein
MKRHYWPIVAICLVSGLVLVYYGSKFQAPGGNYIVTVSQAIQAPPTPTPQSEFPCTDIAANAVARAYGLAIPVEGGTFSFIINESSPLTKYVLSHRRLFKRGGYAIRCAAALGQHVVSLGMETLRSNRDIYEGVSRRWGGQAPDIAASAALELKNQGSDMYSLGSELIWLAEVLPNVTESNYSSFNTADSESRRTLKQYLPLFDTTLGMSGDRELYKQVLSQTKVQYGPNTENALIILASALPRG